MKCNLPDCALKVTMEYMCFVPGFYSLDQITSVEQSIYSCEDHINRIEFDLKESRILVVWARLGSTNYEQVQHDGVIKQMDCNKEQGAIYLAQSGWKIKNEMD
jgi:hypothetical protein